MLHLASYNEFLSEHAAHQHPVSAGVMLLAVVGILALLFAYPTRPEP